MNLIEELEKLKTSYSIIHYSPKTNIQDIRCDAILDILIDNNLAKESDRNRGINKKRYKDRKYKSLGIDLYGIRIGKFICYDFNLEDAFEECFNKWKLSKKRSKLIQYEIIKYSIIV